MEKLMPPLVGLFTFISLCNILWDGFPAFPILYGAITTASFVFGWNCLVSQDLPDSRTSRQVPAEIRWKWCRILGPLYLVNAALCPLGFLLWYFTHFDQDLILVAQILGFLAICFASLIPTFPRRKD